MDAERSGVDTLARHKQMLQTYAEQNHLEICEIYQEVVSGDTIAARPEMQRLLQDVEAGMWKGVLVVEVERLARGDTIDQGIIAQVFKFSETLIVTPLKTYDPNNEYDEEFFEYGLFQSRREYKAITRRQQRGIEQSVKEGKWVYNKAPYGYERYKLPDQKGWSLRIVPDKAEVIKLIYQWYSDEHIGYTAIAEKLTTMHIPAPVEHWSGSTVKDILTNIAYIGKVKRGERACVKKTQNGSLKTSRPRNKDFTYYDGLHEAIIEEELFWKVQEIFKSHPSKPVASALEIRNPLAGLVYCKKCGHKMIRRPQDRCRTMIICPVKSCDNISCYESVLEETVISSLENYLEELKLEKPAENEAGTSTLHVLNSSLTDIDKEKDTLSKQLENAYDLVEQGVYSPELFLKRSKTIEKKLAECDQKKEDIQKQITREEMILNRRNILIPKIETTLNVYDTLDPAGKNAMLTEIIESIEYEKTERSPKNGPYNNFNIVIHPRIPL
jgi:DNA invertase Pin-like site-specific DNA recombinase